MTADEKKLFLEIIDQAFYQAQVIEILTQKKAKKAVKR